MPQGKSTLKCSKYLCCSFFVFGILMSIGGCAKKETGLAAYPDIKEIFTETEIQDLTTILGFFEHQICDMQRIYTDSILDCYRVLFKGMSTTPRTRPIYIPVPFHAQEEMYKSLSEAGFREIWTQSSYVNQTTGNTVTRISLNHEGKFVQFLDALKSDYQILTAYYNSFLREQRVSETMIDGMLYNYPEYNMRDLRMRLLVAIHYLTLNDIYERRRE